MKKLIITVLALISAGCGGEQEHKIYESGAETGVRIEVVLVGGGSAVLICPKLISKRIGSHGVECYLRSYDKLK